MLPKCSLTKYICINAFDYNAIIVYFTVLKPGTLYLVGVCPVSPVPRYLERSQAVSSLTVCRDGSKRDGI